MKRHPRLAPTSLWVYELPVTKPVSFEDRHPVDTGPPCKTDKPPRLLRRSTSRPGPETGGPGDECAEGDSWCLLRAEASSVPPQGQSKNGRMTGSQASLPQTDSGRHHCPGTALHGRSAGKEEPRGDPVARRSREAVTVTGPGVHRKGRRCRRLSRPRVAQQRAKVSTHCPESGRARTASAAASQRRHSLGRKGAHPPAAGAANPSGCGPQGAAENCPAESASPASWRLETGVPSCTGSKSVRRSLAGHLLPPAA